MFDVKAYSRAVRETASRLEKEHGEFLYIISLENPARDEHGGCVTHVSAQTAAEQIVKGAARPATEQEIATFHEKAERFRRQIADADNTFKYRSPTK